MIPFDTRYTPDLIFATNARLSDRFPHDAGQGVLNLMFPERAFCKFANLAHCAVIVDDFLIQFSERGNMYVLDIIKGTVTTYQVVENDVPVELADWLKNTGAVAVKMMDAVEKSRTAPYYLQLYTTLLFYHTTSMVDRSSYVQAMGKLRQGFGLESNSDVLRIVNGNWYYGSERKTWGNIALNIFRDDFKEFNTYFGV